MGRTRRCVFWGRLLSIMPRTSMSSEKAPASCLWEAASARSRFPLMRRLSGACQSAWPCLAVNQFPSVAKGGAEKTAVGGRPCTPDLQDALDQQRRVINDTHKRVVAVTKADRKSTRLN